MDFTTALSRMAALCSISEHCESEIREKLQRVDMTEADIQRVVDQLYDEQYLDTERYCRAFANDKLRFAHWGRLKIQQALRMKGLPDSDIRQALDELPEEEYENVLSSLVRQKLRSIHDEDEYTRRGKLVRFLAGRGFAINEVLDYLDNSDDL